MKHPAHKRLCALTALLMALMMAALPIQAAEVNRLEKIKADGKIVMVTSPDYAPYEFLDQQGNPVGADISLGQHIAQQLGVELVIDPMDFDTVLAAIVTGKADMGIAGMVPKEERKETMDYTDIYYNDGDQVLVILKEKAESLKTLSDFAGKTVAAQNGTLQQQLVTEQIPDATMEPIVKIPDAIMMVMTGKVDGVALASVVADQYVANYPDLTICETRFEYASLGVAIGVPKGNSELLDALNTIVKDVLDKGLYNQWMQEAVELSNSLSQ